MDTSVMIEVFGYIGSALVVVSMLMSSIVKLRVINTIGSIISGIYAVICGAFPLALMNFCLITINAVSLYKLLRTKQSYDLVAGNADDAMAAYLIKRYTEDIRAYFPDLDRYDLDGKRLYMVCCDGAPAGILLGEEKDGVFDVLIDYSTPAYRDCSVGAYLYSRLPSEHIKALRFSQKATDTHIAYMKKMGFTEEAGIFVKKLA